MPDTQPEFLDVDGTAMSYGGVVSDELRAAVADVVTGGLHVVLATGRSLRAAKDAADAIGLSTGWMVCSNGAVVARLDPDEPTGYEVTKVVTFDPAPALKVLVSELPSALYAVENLGVGYLVFLGLLRWWAGRLVGERSDFDAGLDLPDLPLPRGVGFDAPREFLSGGGGDFGGGGAEGNFDVLPDAASSIGDVAKGALEVAGDADEGAVVVVPVVVVFLGAVLVLLGLGSLLLLFFGWEVLLTVAVEVAFGYVSARTAVST